ncbi:hypothetical protein THAOC_27185, partial [Thalassiosira oceanica]
MRVPLTGSGQGLTSLMLVSDVFVVKWIISGDAMTGKLRKHSNRSSSSSMSLNSSASA